MAAGFSRGGKKSNFAGFYLQVGLRHIVIGGGLPFISKDILRKIRIEIGYRQHEFERIIEFPDFITHFGFIHGENEHTLPKSFEEVYEENPMIANKQFYYGTLLKTEEWLFETSLKTMILEKFSAGLPFNQFMIQAISNFNGYSIHHHTLNNTL